MSKEQLVKMKKHYELWLRVVQKQIRANRAADPNDTEWMNERDTAEDVYKHKGEETILLNTIKNLDNLIEDNDQIEEYPKEDLLVKLGYFERVDEPEEEDECYIDEDY